ncbi:MAG: PadR family transcriptional regulator [Chloroflexi bacterium]|nr:PadR family transcriptional regulator [Chloroflexota bacterium]
MSLRNHLLGLIANRPRSGYSLHKSFFEPVRPALSQIYRTLTDMCQEGLVDFERVEQEKLPDQKVYCITEAGRAELDRWLKEPVPLKTGRDRFVAQLWFSSLLDKAEVINNINTYADDVRRQIEWFDGEARRLAKKGVQSSDNQTNELYWNLAIDCSIAQMEAWLKWADNALKRLESLKSKKAKCQALVRKRRQVKKKEG